MIVPEYRICNFAQDNELHNCRVRVTTPGASEIEKMRPIIEHLQPRANSRNSWRQRVHRMYIQAPDTPFDPSPSDRLVRCVTRKIASSNCSRPTLRRACAPPA